MSEWTSLPHLGRDELRTYPRWSQANKQSGSLVLGKKAGIHADLFATSFQVRIEQGLVQVFMMVIAVIDARASLEKQYTPDRTTLDGA